MSHGVDRILSVIDYAGRDPVGSYWSVWTACVNLDAVIQTTHGGKRQLNLSEGAKIGRAPLFELRDLLRAALRQGRKARKDIKNKDEDDGCNSE
jgi:hypothetical protein